MVCNKDSNTAHLQGIGNKDGSTESSLYSYKQPVGEVLKKYTCV